MPFGPMEFQSLGYIHYSDASKLTKHHHETFRLGGMHICLDVRSNRILDECSAIFEKLVPIIWHKTTSSLMESCFVSVYFVRYWRTGSYNPTCTRPPHLCLGFNPLIRVAQICQINPFSCFTLILFLVAPPDLSLSSDKDKVLFHTGAHKSNPINSEDESLEGRKVPPQNSDHWGSLNSKCV